MKRYNRSLLINSFYSGFSVALAKCLSEKQRAIVTSLGYSIYLQGVDLHRFNDGALSVSSEPAPNLRCFPFLFYREERLVTNNVGLTSEETDFFTSYYRFCESIILNKKIDLIIVHNEFKWSTAIPLEIAKKNRIASVVVERGLFRPHTVSLDFRNVNTPLPKNGINLYIKNESIHLSFDRMYSISKYKQFVIYTRFFVFLILNYFGSLFRINAKINERLWTFKKYAKRILNTHHCCPVVLHHPYILVYLQLEDDSQFQTISSYVDNVEFIDSLLNTCRSINYNCYIKVHPNDTSERYIKYRDNLIYSDKSTSLLQQASLVISISSTALINALLIGKKVLAHESSIYETCPGVTTFNSRNIDKSIVTALKSANVPIVDVCDFFNNIIIPRQYNLNPFFSSVHDFDYVFKS